MVARIDSWTHGEPFETSGSTGGRLLLVRDAIGRSANDWFLALGTWQCAARASPPFHPPPVR